MKNGYSTPSPRGRGAGSTHTGPERKKVHQDMIFHFINLKPIHRKSFRNRQDWRGISSGERHCSRNDKLPMTFRIEVCHSAIKSGEMKNPSSDYTKTSGFSASLSMSNYGMWLT